MTFNCRQCTYLLLHTISCIIFMHIFFHIIAVATHGSDFFLNIHLLSKDGKCAQNGQSPDFIMYAPRGPYSFFFVRLKINWKCIATEDIGLQLISCHCVSFNLAVHFAHNLIAVNLLALFSSPRSLIYRRSYSIGVHIYSIRMQCCDSIAFAQHEY